jgi:hydrogenase nickel incorporation protein HypA/HybF
MHEVGIMQSAVDLAIDHASRQGAKRIHALTLRIGKLAGVEPDALRFAFEVVTGGTMAEKAALVVEETPIVCFCAACQTEFRPDDFIFVCPSCKRLSGEVRQGQELELSSVEVS